MNPASRLLARMVSTTSRARPASMIFRTGSGSPRTRCLSRRRCSRRRRPAGVAVVTLDRQRPGYRPSSANTGANTLKSGRCPPPWYGSLATITSPGNRSSPRNSSAKRTGRVRRSMNCGIPTDRAARRPRRVEDRGVALVALVEDRCGRGPRHVRRHLEADGLHRRADHLGGDRVDGSRPLSRPRLPASCTRSTFIVLPRGPPRNMTPASRLS